MASLGDDSKTREVGQISNGVLGVFYILTVLTVLSRNYVRASAVGRRQLRWLIYGLYVGLVPVVFSLAIRLVAPEVKLLGLVSISMALIPVCILIAIVRYNLFDIDRLISGTVSYTFLVILLALGGELLFEPLAGRITLEFGLGAATGQTVFVMLLAAGLVPAQRLWRPYVDRIFFTEQVTLEKSVEDLLTEVTRLDSNEDLIGFVTRRIAGLFEPIFCGAFELTALNFRIAATAGSAELPSVLELPALEDQLATRVGPILLDVRGASRGDLSTMRREFGNLDAALIVPLRRDGAPYGFIGLGSKRSGDVYTTSDLSLLSAVAHAVSARL